MAKIATVKQPEQWIKEVNGGYDVLFETILMATAVPEEGVYSEGGEVVGIVAQVKENGYARMMVRGNPSVVDIPVTSAQRLALEAKGIVSIGATL